MTDYCLTLSRPLPCRTICLFPVIAPVASQHRAEFYTANGWSEAFIIRLDRLRIGATDVRPIHVAVLNSEGLEAHGLLGMNALQNFQFAIDQHTATAPVAGC